jgi:capsid protein
MPELAQNWLDRAICATFPDWGARRLIARQAMASYKGGVPTRTSELWTQAQGFRFGTTSERQQVLGTRDRAYQAYDNNPVARTLVQTETDNVIGDGLNYQPASSSEEWNREAEDRYYRWLEECSVRGPDVETGCEVQRSIWSYSRVAGDIGWVLVSRGPESRIQVVRAENICTPDGKQTDPSIYDGIRFDQFGRPTTFYVLSTDERNGRRTFTEIAARDFVWFPHMTKPGQARPPSCYATIFDLLAHLDRYVDGVSLAAWMATVFGIIFKESSASRQVANLPYATNSQGTQQRALTLENGQVKYTAPEGEVVQVDAKQPMQQTPEFIRTMYRMLGQPFDMPLEVIAKDMSTCTFASARIGLNPFYRSCRIKAGRFGSRWSRTIRWWLSRERQRTADDPNRWSTPFPADYWNHELLPNAWDYTDPLTDPQSDLLQIDMGIKSPQMVAMERGRNWQRIRDENKTWRDEAGDTPVLHSTYTRDPAPEPTDAPANPNTDTPDDGTDTNPTE